MTLAPITFALLGFLLAAVSSLVAGGLPWCIAYLVGAEARAAGRGGGGSGTYVVQWSDIQWRSLLGAPT